MTGQTCAGRLNVSSTRAGESNERASGRSSDVGFYDLLCSTGEVEHDKATIRPLAATTALSVRKPLPYRSSGTRAPMLNGASGHHL